MPRLVSSIQTGSAEFRRHYAHNKRLAAEMLKVSLKTVYNKLKQYNLE